MLEEIGLLVTYITMGIAPIAYNFLTAKRALLKRRAGQCPGPKEGRGAEGACHEVRSFTVTVPCGVGPTYVVNDRSNVAYFNTHLNINSVSSSYITHVRRVLSQG
ncbi:MAG: hypothetical protein QXT74_05460 [Candidatus Nezhaarchaeales archaeon]